jgi:hypothetical protein
MEETSPQGKILEADRLPALLLKCLPYGLDALAVDVPIRFPDSGRRAVLHHVLPTTKSPKSARARDSAGLDARSEPTMLPCWSLRAGARPHVLPALARLTALAQAL